MKSTFYFCFFAFLLAFNSCSDDDINSPEGEIQEESQTHEGNLELVIKNTARTFIETIDCPPRVANFNDNGQISEIISCDVIFRTFTRNNEGLITGITGVGGFGYENAQWVYSSSGNDTGAIFRTYSYDNSVMTSESIDNNGDPVQFENIFMFEDDSYEKLISFESINITVDEIWSRTTFQYNDNNDLINTSFEIRDNTTNELNLFRELSFSYDNKTNPYKSGFPTNPGFQLLTPFLFWEYEENIALSSDHNITEIVITNYSQNFTFSITKDYEYNDLDYPIQMTESHNGEPKYTHTFEYY